MNTLDYVVLVGTILAIAGYGIWRTRGRRDLDTYLKGAGNTSWMVVGLSVMATQASAITFLSMPGQGYESGLGFVQIYFGMPLALIIIAAVFLPIYRRLKVHTAYEYLGQRFGTKTRLLAAALFLLQRGFGAGITIYAPAIVLSTVMGWRLDITIICCGLVATIYTVAGGSDAVSLTQKYQIGVIFVGMFAAFFIVLAKLSRDITLTDGLHLAGDLGKMKAVDFSIDPKERYTIWSGLLGGVCLSLSYFGTDQSQVQRYISGGSLRESRLGLMFNAVCKIPMQLFILMIGIVIFLFYQFETPPVYFNEVAWKELAKNGTSAETGAIDANFMAAHTKAREQINLWLNARRTGNAESEAAARAAVIANQQQIKSIRKTASLVVDPNDKIKDTDYVFISFIIHHLPHGLIGLLVTAFFAAALSSKAAELNALGSTTTVDFYRHVVNRQGSDAHYVMASKCFIVLWGAVAISFALFASLAENLIQAVNIVGSIFYGVVLGLFLAAFFLRHVGGNAVFLAALVAQVLVIVIYWTSTVADFRTTPTTNDPSWRFALYYSSTMSYLWYNLIGCAACVLLSLFFQAALGRATDREQEQPSA